MGLRISLDTETLSRGDTVTLAKMLEAAFPGALADALGAPPTLVTTGQTLAEAGADYIRLETRRGPEVLLTADLSNLPPPVAPTGAVPIPPAPPSGVASATPPAPAASPATPDRDVNGLPWDGRIHASTKVRNADGSWRAKRGVDDALVATVTAELRQNAAAPAPGVTVTQGPIQDVPTPPAPVDTTGAPPPPAAPTPPPPPPPAPATLSGPQLFARYMERVTAAQTGGLVTTADVAAIATGLGLVGTAGLLQRPDLVPHAEADLDALLASRTA